MESSTTLPNPDIYLNHLPFNEAAQFEIARNVYLTILGAAILDVLVYIPDDVRILRKGLNAATFCFIFSRVFSITYVVLFIAIQTHPVTHCGAMSISMEMSCLLAMASASFLFLRRLHAVYADSTRMIRWIFTLLWVGVSICGIATFFGTHVEHISGTDYCTVYGVDSYVSIVEFLPAAFDTIVFFGISYRLITTHRKIDHSLTLSGAITGKSLPRLSRALLHGGQQYYLIVFGVTIVSGAILYTPSIPPIYRLLMTLASITLTASMACRVFRNLKTFEDDQQSSFLPTTSISFVGPPSSGDKGDNVILPISRESRKSKSFPVGNQVADDISRSPYSNSDSRSDFRAGATASQSYLAQLANEAMLMGSAGVVFGR